MTHTVAYPLDHTAVKATLNLSTSRFHKAHSRSVSTTGLSKKHLALKSFKRRKQSLIHTLTNAMKAKVPPGKPASKSLEPPKKKAQMVEEVPSDESDELFEEDGHIEGDDGEEEEGREDVFERDDRFNAEFSDDDGEDEGEANTSEEEDTEDDGEESAGEDDHNDVDEPETDSEDLPHPDTTPPSFPTNPTPLSKSTLTKLHQKIDKSGVCYLSRIPPFMKPQKLRTLLSRYGTLNRIYLAPESPTITARRKKYKHNRRQNFTEGWVEFTDKSVARSVATLLNGNQIGGKKRSFYYDDIWNIKYLPKFKWHHLAEQIAYEVKVREQRLKAEMAQARRENKTYVKNVEKAKMIEGMEEKRAKKRKAEESQVGAEVDAGEGTSVGAAPLGMDGTEAIRRRFKQRKVVDSGAEGAKTTTSKTKALLGRIFS